MNGRSDVAIADRFFASIAYLLPIMDVIKFGSSIFDVLPFFRSIYVALMPLIQIYLGMRFASFAIFLLLYFFVLRNQNVARFIRFNVLQAVMLGILISLTDIAISSLLSPIMGADSALISVLSKVIFLGTWAICAFGIGSSMMGKYADVPQLSENTHFMVDRM
jgi:Chloroplast import apparatus Tic20-like